MVKKIGIIGLGNVGEATIKMLTKYSSLIYQRSGFKIQIKAVCDKKKVKNTIAKKYSIPFEVDAFKLINDSEIDIIVELIGGIEPAKTFIIEALKKRKNVVTANKALLAQHGKQIFSLAKKVNKIVGFEASVCGAIPLIKSISDGLVCCEIREMFGILNGTTNYILTKMSKEKIDFSLALRQAQKKGFAEKNPSLDIDGIDTLHKLSILSYLCFGVWPPLDKVYTEGISKVSLLDILYAQELNYCIKLLAIAKKDGNFLDLRVHPTLISMDHPLSEVSSVYNAVFLETHPAGKLLFYGLGAGGEPTSSSIISDIVNIALQKQKIPQQEEDLKLKSINKIKARYYVRFMAYDRPGVLAQISKILALFKISIASVTQKERNKGRLVPIVMLTHEAYEANIRKAINKIDTLSVIKSPSQVLRIENL
ncbi:MAG: homoserine dehydrogenase [Candidatus Omnitrophica bacterium]|nr:homoserine dehydrogenase [Candidatus Omnitrophota bacterium]